MIGTLQIITRLSRRGGILKRTDDLDAKPRPVVPVSMDSPRRLVASTLPRDIYSTLITAVLDGVCVRR